MSKSDVIYLKDYQVPSFLVEDIYLDIDLHDGLTTVTAKVNYRQNPDCDKPGPLVLMGEKLTLKSMHLDGQPQNHNHTNDVKNANNT